MPSFTTLLGSCLIAAGTMYPWSAAVAADRPANSAGKPWWSNSPPVGSPDAGPKITEYPPATARSGPKAAEIAAPRREGSLPERAPDPPGLHLGVQPAVFQQDSTAAAERTKAGEPARDAASPAAPPAAGPSSPPARPGLTLPLGLGGHNDKNALGKTSPLAAMLPVGGSLALVLGLFLIVAWVMRKVGPRGARVLPQEVFEILGRAPLGARQQVQLLRCGNKLLLVSITPGGAETLTEVVDPLEIEHIIGICQQARPQGAATAFRQVFQELAPNAGEPSELDNLDPAGTRRKRYRWEENHA